MEEEIGICDQCLMERPLSELNKRGIPLGDDFYLFCKDETTCTERYDNQNFN